MTLLIVAEARYARLHTALSLAAALAALQDNAPKAPVQVFFQGEAVQALTRWATWAEDSAHKAVGSPTLPELLDLVIGLGASVTACSSGLAVTGLTAPDLRPDILIAGLLHTLSTPSPSRQIIVI